MNNPFIISQSTYLRSPEPGDENIIAISENHPEPRETLFYALPTSIEQHKNRIKSHMEDHKTIFLIICDKQSDKPIGCAAFFRIDWIGRMAIYYIAIAEKENWSKGYGKEVTRLMVDYAFETLNLNRIQLHVSVENERAVNAYKKAGFQIEGTLRQAMFHQNKFVDFFVMGILKEDRQKNN
jgi:RimJ/RimL family protein N-acetyltransferase